MRFALRSLGVIGLLVPAVAFAQLNVAGVDPLTLSYTPQYPRPGSVIIVTPQSTLFNIANSTMTLSVNGKQVYSGSTRGVEVTVGGKGQTTSVLVRVTSLGQSFTRTLAIKPVDVSLIVEPISSAPALYPGKPLPPTGGTVRLVAVADFRTAPTTRLDPDTLSYSWSIDGTTLVKDSGIGKNSIVLPTPLAYRSQAVAVRVLSPGGSLAGGDSFSFSSYTPSLRLYVQDPLQGIVFDRALSGTYALTGSETTFIAAPFSFSTAQGAPTVEWFLGGTLAQTGPAITLRPEGAGRGTASLSARVSAGIETSATSLSVSFGETTSFFGL